MIKIKFISPKVLDKNLKATIHITGKLGFTVEAAKKLNLAQDKGIAIGINEDDENDKNLYVVVHDSVEGDDFKVNKAGNYFYINTTSLFDSFKWDYKLNSIWFDITMMDGENEGIYRFNRKEKVKKNNIHN